MMIWDDENFLFIVSLVVFVFFFFQAEDGIRDRNVTGVQTCALPISMMDAYALGQPCRRSLSIGVHHCVQEQICVLQRGSEAVRVALNQRLRFGLFLLGRSGERRYRNRRYSSCCCRPCLEKSTPRKLVESHWNTPVRLTPRPFARPDSGSATWATKAEILFC